MSVSVGESTTISVHPGHSSEEHSCRPKCPSLYAEGVWGDKNSVICKSKWHTLAEIVVPNETVTDKLVETLLKSADGTVRLRIHPRCRHLIRAFQSYARAKRNNHWMDYPEPECHPHEDLIDPLAGGLTLEFPEGRTPQPQLRRIHAASLY